MLHCLELQTIQRNQMIDLTGQVRQIVVDHRIIHGTISVFVPHTTAGVTINEIADPNVIQDIFSQLDKLVSSQQPVRHPLEGISAANLKASLMGSSVSVLVHDRLLLLGRRQGIWFCEFEGPRNREVVVNVQVGIDPHESARPNEAPTTNQDPNPSETPRSTPDTG